MSVFFAIVFVTLLLLWAMAWRREPRFAFGILVGVGVAWIAVTIFQPYLTGVQAMPVWLPALPLALLAVVLLVLGIVVWFKDDASLPKPPPPEEHHGH